MTTQQEKRRAIFRLILGNSQMAGAAVTVVLLWRLGVCKPTVIAGAITGASLVASLLIFRIR